MSPEIVVAPAPGLAATMLQRLGALQREAVAERGRFAVAVPGGSVATLLFPVLARGSLDWGRTDVFWVDERAVPPDDAMSNYGLARGLWLDPVRIDPARVHRMRGEATDPAAAAREAERELVDALGDPPRLDLALLGVGPDGHVASLFPGHAALAERSRYVLAVADAPKPPPRRLTLTLAAIGSARSLWVAALGAEKAAAIGAAVASLRAAERGERARPSELPVTLALRSGPPGCLFLDPEAASGLELR